MFRRHHQNISDYWPLLGGQDHFLMNRSGELTACFQLRLPEIFSSDREDYIRRHEAWSKGIRLFGEGTLFHQQDWYVEKQVHENRDGDDFLDHHNRGHFQGRPYMEHECYLFISRLSSSQIGMLSSGLFRSSRSGFSQKKFKEAHAFGSQCTQFQHWMGEQAGIEIRALDPEELWSDALRVGLLERYMQLSGKGDRRLSQDLSFLPPMHVGDRRLAIYSISSLGQLPAEGKAYRDFGPYGTTTHPFPLGFASPLGQLLSVNHIYQQYLFLASPRAQIQLMESKSRRFHALSAYSGLHGLTRDACLQFVRDTQEKNFLPVKSHFHLLTWGRKGDWESQVSQVHAAFHQMGMAAKEETLAASRLFWSGIPGNGGALAREEAMDLHAESALCFFNMETGNMDTSPVKGIRLAERITGRPFYLDLSDEPMNKGWIRNRNKFILCPSGSGKSFFTNHMVRAYYHQGAHIVLIDVGHSYEGLCRYLQGYYFCYDPQQPIGFNPFYLGEDEFPDAEKMESLKNLLVCLWKKDQQDLGRSEYVALSELVSGFYQSLSDLKVFACFDRFYEYVDRLFSHQDAKEDIREKDFDAQNFLFVLRPYYRGGDWDFLLNAKDPLEWTSHRLIVFELDRIKDHPVLFGLVTLIIMDVFLTKMRKQKGERKIMLIEEAWKAIAKQGMAAYMLYLFKTVRKHYGEAVVVTQEIDDMIHSPILHQAIIQNSDCKILLDQSKYVNDWDPVSRLLGLSDRDRDQIMSLNRSLQPGDPYKEVFIALGPNWSRVYRVEVSLAEYYIYTTEEKEKLLVQEYERKCGGLIQGIERLVADRRAGFHPELRGHPIHSPSNPS